MLEKSHASFYRRYIPPKLILKNYVLNRNCRFIPSLVDVFVDVLDSLIRGLNLNVDVTAELLRQERIAGDHPSIDGCVVLYISLLAQNSTRTATALVCGVFAGGHQRFVRERLWKLLGTPFVLHTRAVPARLSTGFMRHVVFTVSYTSGYFS